MRMRVIHAVIFVLILASAHAQQRFKLGVDVFLDVLYPEYRGKRLGLITNATGMTSGMISTIDGLYSLENPKLVALFAPEHGLRGDVHAGEEITDDVDRRTGLPVHSLYGRSRKPSKKMLENIDVLIYDIQDTGNRTYTYIYTMAYAMEAAAENNIEFIVLDRPIPMYGHLVDGNVLEERFSSFIGRYPIPYVYGMTPGELAMFFNNEFNIHAKLTVVRMEGYSHEMDFRDTGLFWIPPSPHIPRYETAYYCAATGAIGELGTLCIGIGYTLPFELIGQEGIDGYKLAGELNSRELPGVFFRPTVFKPFYSGFKDKSCSGVQILITDTKRFLPFSTQIHILEAVQKLYPERQFLGKEYSRTRMSGFNRAAGTDRIIRDILDGKTADEIIGSYQKEFNYFLQKRLKVLLYE